MASISLLSIFHQIIQSNSSVCLPLKNLETRGLNVLYGTSCVWSESGMSELEKVKPLSLKYLP